MVNLMRNDCRNRPSRGPSSIASRVISRSASISGVMLVAPVTMPAALAITLWDMNEAAIQAKVDPLENLKENVICGHLIPGGTGLRDYDDLVVGSKADLESLQQAQ